MRRGRFLYSTRYDKKGRLVIQKGIRIGAFRFWLEEIRLTQEELHDIGLLDQRKEEALQD